MGALHEAEMSRFQDILDGYLQIKENPKNYYNAEERLEQAKLALEQFDKNLDETLRQLNESELSDFDISLRMMNNAEEDD
jgi:5-bromo-4-chloroindolyl phosphate hydrolysis protein